MKIIIPVNVSDQKMLLSFVSVLSYQGVQPDHECIIVHDKKSEDVAKSLEEYIKHIFPSGLTRHGFSQDSPTGWPEGPNFYWVATINYLKSIKNEDPWLWMELDLIPLVNDWCNKIESVYYASGKPFVGWIENVYNNNIGNDEISDETLSNKVKPRKIEVKPRKITHNNRIKTGEHMAGIGMYPADMDKHCPSYRKVTKCNQAFDYILGWEIGHQAHHTPAINHSYVTGDYSIKDGKILHNRKEYFLGELNERPITNESILHHGCKDGTLALLIITNQLNDILNQYN